MHFDKTVMPRYSARKRLWHKMYSSKGIVGVDLFCGAGGLTHGLIREGINIAAGYDIDPAAEFAFSQNNRAKFIRKDIKLVTGKEIAEQFQSDKFSLLAGCAPCQPFSSYTNSIKTKDEKWGLLNHFARLICEAAPDFVTMENVPNLERQDVFQDFLNLLNSEGYFYSYKVVSCPDYGIPQARRRLVLVASRRGEIQIIPPTHSKKDFMTVRQSIGHLPAIKAGQQDEEDALHICSKLSNLNEERIKYSKQGGTWRDWPKHLVANCHVKKTGKSYPSVYGRMSWDKPSPTITTQCYGFGNGRFGHPEQNRGLSLREASILQTFPDSYQFLPKGQKVKMREIGTLIGNAVPVRLGEVVAISLKKHIETL